MSMIKNYNIASTSNSVLNNNHVFGFECAGLGRSEQCSITYLTPVQRDARFTQTLLGDGAGREQFSSVALRASRKGLVVDTRAQFTRLSLALWI